MCSFIVKVILTLIEDQRRPANMLPDGMPDLNDMLPAVDDNIAMKKKKRDCLLGEAKALRLKTAASEIWELINVKRS